VQITTFDQLQAAWRTLTVEYKKAARGPATYPEFFRVSEGLFDPARLVMEGEMEEAEEKRACLCRAAPRRPCAC
jgi:hypothetical protein